MRFAIVYFLIHMSILSYAQMRPLPAVLVASFTSDQEPDIHNRIPEVVVNNDRALLEKIQGLQDIKSLYAVENSRLQTELAIIQHRRKLEKKIAGIAGILLFASGNETLKNVGLVSLFCYSMW